MPSRRSRAAKRRKPKRRRSAASSPSHAGRSIVFWTAYIANHPTIRLHVSARLALGGKRSLAPELRSVYLYNLTLLILRVLRPFMLRDEISGRELLKRPGPLIIASNHVGWLEILLVSATLWPRKVRFMAKRELFAHPAAAWALRGLGTFPISREHPAPSEWKTALRLLREGNTVCVLASGTRGGQQAKQGVARLALASGVPLITARYSGPPSPKVRFLLRRPHVTLRFDVALESADRQCDSARSRSHDITRRVNESLHAEQGRPPRDPEELGALK